ncbi:hypothetical protein L6164_035896 [Bauhinia variegata]|uniref:Uncharacterized protein n=1 Tax=Bauhinia variegata TaxID=167791 RepID=A0ACB9KFD9_BAUVA|nr:hypothetical protein L6164_035896 [Bauhinia variegata]
MADWRGFLSKSSGFGGRSMVDEDFDEEDVWGLVKEKGDSSTKIRVSKDISGSSSAWRLSAAPRTIPRANAQTGHEAQVVQRSSAPLEIPDWSKIYGRNAKKGSKDGESNRDAFGYGYGGDGRDDEDEGEDGEDDMVPPHEWIARKLARNQISSFSVCEGIGRTLKGRDLSKVRNAVLTKTGFIE